MMSEEDEQFQSSNACWICEKRIDDDVEKFRDAAHWSCNINLWLIKKVPVIFHNLRGYDSHLNFRELNKFDVKVIRNTKWDSSLEKLVKYLSENEFKYLTENFRALKRERCLCLWLYEQF